MAVELPSDLVLCLQSLPWDPWGLSAAAERACGVAPGLIKYANGKQTALDLTGRWKKVDGGL